MKNLEIIISESEAFKSIREVLESYFLARKKIYLLETNQKVFLNNHFQPFETRVYQNDVLSIDFSLLEERNFIPQKGSLKVLFEDEWVLLIEKPVGIIIYPDTPDGMNTLVNQVRYYFDQTGFEGSVRYLHRLDRDTTGVMMFAKNPLSHSFLTEEWDHFLIKRYYYALCEGTIQKPEGTITKPIGKDRHRNNHYIAISSGKPSITHYQVIKQGKNNTAVSLLLETGRTHQIRVHLASLGNPLWGDQQYGAREMRDRVYLHSAKIVFTHPYTKEIITVCSPENESFLGLL